MRNVLLIMNTQEQAGAIEEAPALVQPGHAHRVVVGADQVSEHQWRTVRAGYAPAVLVALGDGAGLAALLGGELVQVFGKFAHQVAAGNPHRQAHLLLLGGLGDGERDAKKVGLHIVQCHLVVDGRKRRGRQGGGGSSVGSQGKVASTLPPRALNDDDDEVI